MPASFINLVLIENPIEKRHSQHYVKHEANKKVLVMKPLITASSLFNFSKNKDKSGDYEWNT